MANKVTLSSSHIDSHGDTLKDGLANMVIAINKDHKMRMLLNHKRELPPIGFWDNGVLVQEQEHLYVKAEENFYGDRTNLWWDSNLVLEKNEKSINLSNRNEITEILTFSVDKNNFRTFEDFENYSQDLRELSQEKINVDLRLRKAIIPHPELVIKIASAHILYQLLKPLVKHIGEKIADDVADYLYKVSKSNIKQFQKYIFKTIRFTREKTIPKNKILTTIFEIPGEPYIELSAKTDNAELISKSLTERKFQYIRCEIERLSNYLAISEIHFSLNDKGGWKLTYLVTKQGEIIGTRKAFDERDKLHKKILLSPTVGYSMSGDRVKYEKQGN